MVARQFYQSFFQGAIQNFDFFGKFNKKEGCPGVSHPARRGGIPRGVRILARVGAGRFFFARARSRACMRAHVVLAGVWLVGVNRGGSVSAFRYAETGRRDLWEEQPLIRCRLTAPHPLRGQTRFAVCPIRLTAPQAARPSGGRRRLWRESTPREAGLCGGMYRGWTSPRLPPWARKS